MGTTLNCARTNAMEKDRGANPQRIVLRFDVRYEREEMAIINAFFTSQGLTLAEDYYSHLCSPNESNKMHNVLDLYCKTITKVDLSTIEHKVFKVRKSDNLCVFSPSKTPN